MNKADGIVGWLKKYLLGVAIVVGGLSFIHVFLLIAPSFNDWSFGIESELAGRFGNFIGGYVGSVFLLLSVVLLYFTLANQREMFQIQQFENRFYQMLRIARENSNEVESKGENGRRVFISIKEEVEKAFRIIVAQDKKGEIMEKDKINLAYLITFYGAGPSSREQLKIDKVVVLGNKELVENVIAHFAREYDKAKFMNEGCPRHERQYLEFDGHQSRLGHYYRHLFQTVSYVNDQRLLSYEKKYQYVRTLRAQLSTHEQAIFFFNSLSTMGRPWEAYVKDFNKKLVTKYNLIKNIPQGFIGDIDFKKYYPDIHYEGEEKTENRIQLERLYK